MHEFGLCEGVLEAVRKRASGRQVAGIRVRFGVRHAVDAESLAQAFQVVAAGTEAAGAAVDLVTVPARLACRDCGFDAGTTDLLATCPNCGGGNVGITGGDEMTLESVSYVAVPATGIEGPEASGAAKRPPGQVTPPDISAFSRVTRSPGKRPPGQDPAALNL